MIEFIKGDLFDSLKNPKVGMLVNPVNTKGVMGAGLALQFKQLFPYNYTLYQDVCKTGKMHPGDVLIVCDQWEDREILVANFATKDHWKEPSRIEWIRIGLSNLKAQAIKDKCSIASPWVGCGLGLLKKSDVKREIRREFEDFPYDFYVFGR